MTDIDQLHGVVGHAVEQDNVVALHHVECGSILILGVGLALGMGVSGVGEVVLVAGLTGGIGDPLLGDAQQGLVQVVLAGEAGGFGIDQGNGGIEALGIGDSVHDQALCGFLSGGTGSLILGIGVGDGTVLTGGAADQVVGHGDIVVVVAVAVVVQGVLGIGGLDLVLRAGQSAGVIIVVGAGQDAGGQVLTVSLLVGAGAVHGLQVGLQIGEAIAVHCVEGGVLDGSVHGEQLGIGGSVAGGIGGICQGIGAGCAFKSRVQEVIRPGLVLSFVVELLIQGLGGIQQIGEPVGIFTAEIVDVVDIVVVQLGAADIVAIDSGCHGIALNDTAVGDAIVGAEADGDDQHGDDHNAEHDGVDLQFLGFLLLSHLPFGHFFGSLCIAELLLAGCTHVIKSSH